MKLKKTLLASVLTAGLLGMSAASEGASILFQFNPFGAGLGAGLINGAATLDEAPGNDLALGGAPGPFPVGTVLQDLYQANLNSVLGPTSNVLFPNGGAGGTGPFFTFVAGFGETVTGSTILAGNEINTFNVNPGGFFKICTQAAVGNDLAGTGFSCAGNGILSGHLVGGTASQTGQLPPPFGTTNPVPFDQFGADNYGILTVPSTGAANLMLQIDTVNPGYFPDLLVGGFITMSVTNSSLITPFQQVDPSHLFSSNGVANGDVPNNIGGINGISGPNFQFQADANSSFARIVPEPGTLALLGIALAGLGGAIRRRNKDVEE
jgi:PEP-CTERM motif